MAFLIEFVDGRVILFLGRIRFDGEYVILRVGTLEIVRFYYKDIVDVRTTDKMPTGLMYLETRPNEKPKAVDIFQNIADSLS